MTHEISPEDFLEVLGMKKDQILFCERNSIFTVRQLAMSADASLYGASSFENAVKLAKEIVDNYSRSPPEEQAKKRRVEEKPEVAEKSVWACTYIGLSTHDQIKRDSALKSPYVLFQEYLECEPNERDKHEWKNVFYSHIAMAELPTADDIDVFSALIRNGAKSLIGNLDITAGARAIPFLYEWMPGVLHGSAMEIDRRISRDLGNPYISDRYAFPVAINLTLLCKKYEAKLYHLSKDTPWQPMTLQSVRSTATCYPAAFQSFSPGDDLYSKLPHGCIVTPSGTIPGECLKIYPKKEPTVHTVTF